MLRLISHSAKENEIVPFIPGSFMHVIEPEDPSDERD